MTLPYLVALLAVVFLLVIPLAVVQSGGPSRLRDKAEWGLAVVLVALILIGGSR